MRIPFLDYVRLMACMMVIFVHACEYYYIGDDGMQIAISTYAACFVICRLLSLIPGSKYIIGRF